MGLLVRFPQQQGGQYIDSSRSLNASQLCLAVTRPYVRAQGLVRQSPLVVKSGKLESRNAKTNFL